MNFLSPTPDLLESKALERGPGFGAPQGNTEANPSISVFSGAVPVKPCGSAVLSHFSRSWLFATLWAAAHHTLSTGFSRQEYWSGQPFPPPGDLPDPGIGPTSFISPALAGGSFTTSATWEAGSPVADFILITLRSLLRAQTGHA